MKLTVTKRNGSKEPFTESKIEAVIQWAMQGLSGVSAEELLKAANLMFFDNIKTSDIHDGLIRAAGTLISQEKPNYTYVASRLLLQKLYKQICGGIEYPYLGTYLNAGINESTLDPILIDERFDLNQLNEAIQPDRDLLFKYLGLQTLADRYFVRGQQKIGQEAPILEMPQHFWMRVAMGLSLNEEDPTKAAIETYNALSTMQYVNSTPTLFNSGTKHSQMSSCYLNTVADTISANEGDHHYASIFGTIEECANLSKYAGGIGTDWTRVRGASEPIKGTNGKSSGIVPYLKVYNDTAIAVNQCFAPETLVRVADGAKPIKDVQVGDLVLGLRGKYREVRETMSYPQNDKPMVGIRTKHSIEPIYVTSGHPIWAIQDVAQEQSISRTLGQIESGKLKADWVEAGLIKEGDYIGQTIPKEIVSAGIDFSEDDARLYGIMLGDGHCSKKTIGGYQCKEWGVTGKQGEDSIVFVQEYLTQRGFKYSITTFADKDYIQVKWSYGGEQQVKDERGQFTKAENCLPFDYEDLYGEIGQKRISKRFMHLPLAQALALVQGLIDSDGCISRGKEITFTNTSLDLIEGLRYQILRLGVPTAGNKRTRVNSHLPGSPVTVQWDVRIPAFAELAQALGVPEVTKFNWFVRNGIVYSRVTSALPIIGFETVHDLKVDGDASYSLTFGTVHNGGKRNGAFAPYLEVWHPDVLDFMELKKNTGDERRRTHDIYPAIWAADLFFKRVEEGGVWSFFSPNQYPELHDLYGDAFESRYIELEAQGKWLNQMPAVEIWRKWMTMLHDTGHPWVTFKDEANRRNPQGHVGVIRNSNLCTEITLNTSDDETAVCNLGSLVLRNITTDEQLRKTIHTLVRNLDNVIDLNFYPSDRAANSNFRHRPIGMGVMGETEWLVMNDLTMDSPEGLEAIDRLYEKISYYAIEASMLLAKERGYYPSFLGSTWSRGILPIDTARDKTTYLGEAKWQELREQVMKYGVRNSNIMAIAPTATISNIVGTEPSIEPPFEMQYTKSNLSGPFIVIAPSLEHGKPHLVKAAHDYDQTYLIRAAAKRQKWIDQSQSLNLYVRNGIRGRDLAELYMLAWRLGLKTTYYLRSESNEVQIKDTRQVGAAIPQSLETAVVDIPSETKFCSIDNPNCESCQ